MKTYLVLFFVTFVIGITKADCQTSLNKIKVNFNEKKLSEVNFINDISFVPEAIVKSGPALVSESKKIESPDKPIKTLPAQFIEKINFIQVKYAMLMDVAIESLTNLSLYKFVEEWFGIRYRMGGTTKRGIDCSAFTSTLLLAVYSLSVPRTARLQYKSCTHISKDDLLEGDLVFFNTRGGVSHVGVYLSNGRFVHASSSRGVMISSLDDNYFARRFISGGRVD